MESSDNKKKNMFSDWLRQILRHERKLIIMLRINLSLENIEY